MYKYLPKKLNKYIEKWAKKAVIAALLAIFSFQFGYPNLVFAYGYQFIDLNKIEDLRLKQEIAAKQHELVYSREEKLLPLFDEDTTFLTLENEDPRVSGERWVTATAYSSTPDQTDSTPFTTAWQTPVRDGIIAANFLPKGSMVRIPDLYGDKIFIVEDRMNPRYQNRIDIWMKTREEAIAFGIKRIKIEVLAPRVDRNYVLTNFEAYSE